jgi:hypothetical protein
MSDQVDQHKLDHAGYWLWGHHQGAPFPEFNIQGTLSSRMCGQLEEDSNDQDCESIQHDTDPI